MKKLAVKIGIILLGLMAWSGIIAPASQALNVYTKNYSFCSGGYGYYNTWRIYDYNSWEESWLGGSHRDYRVFVGQYRDPGLDGFCRGFTVIR